MSEVEVRQPILSASKLEKKYGGRTVVRGVSLEVSAGEIVGLLGPNGAGKTTTFRMVMGLLRPDGGTITFQNADVTDSPIHARAQRPVLSLEIALP